MNYRRGHRLIFALWVLLLGLTIVHQESHAATLTAAQAKDHVGENATVCGIVASATFAARTKGQPTFLNLDKSYPDHIFSVVIWGSDRPKFHQPEVLYRGKRLCVTGYIKIFRGRPEIIVKELSQISQASAAR